jgi:hypothetical protein
MPDLLNPDRPGDLAALGISDRNPISVEEPVQEETAQATAAEEVEAPVEAPVEEAQVEVQAQETEQAEDDQPKSILSQLETQEEVQPVSDESELARLRQENTRLQQDNVRKDAALIERRQIAEDQIRAAAAQPTPPAEPERYIDNQFVKQTLQSIQEEHPEQLPQAIAQVVAEDIGKTFEVREKALIDRIDKSDTERREAEQRATVKQGISTALNEIKAEGGLHAELVDEFELRGMDSHIGRKMQDTPGMFYSQQGTEDAVRSLESKLRSQIRRAKHPEQEQAVQGTVTSAGTGVASTRGVNLNEKPIVKSPEDEYLDTFTNARRGGAGLEFL